MVPLRTLQLPCLCRNISRQPATARLSLLRAALRAADHRTFPKASALARFQSTSSAPPTKGKAKASASSEATESITDADPEPPPVAKGPLTAR